MTLPENASEVISLCQKLKDNYIKRNSDIAETYSLLISEGDNSDKHSENFISNEPRTLWNMSAFLLTPRPLTTKITKPGRAQFGPESSLAAGLLSSAIDRIWENRDKKERRRQGHGFLRKLVGSFLATGWFSVIRGTQNGDFFVDRWNPSNVYPGFSDDLEVGLESVARITKITYKSLSRIAKKENWDISTIRGNDDSEYDQYQLFLREGNTVYVTIVIGNTIVKNWMSLGKEFPILIGATGGLPIEGIKTIVTGNRTSGNAYMQDIKLDDQIRLQGQGIIGTNKRVYQELNRWMSFYQQIIHDVANPKTIEVSQGDRKIVQSPEQFYARAAHFKLNQNEDLRVLDMPGVPPELTSMILSMRNMIQRGGISDAVFGNMLNEVSAILMSQITESARQILSPYFDELEYLFTEVSNVWLESILADPNKFKDHLTDEEILAAEFLSEERLLEVKTSFLIRIPGDLPNRLATARNASPNFELSQNTITELLIPEAGDPATEFAKVESEKARQHPVMKTMQVIATMRETSIRLELVNPEMAGLYRTAADQLLASTMQSQASVGSGSGQEAMPPGVGPSVLSPQEQMQIAQGQ